MKKTLYETMLTLIEGNESAEANEVRDAINAELAKGKAKADANRAIYADMHDKVMETIRIAGVPVSAQDIATSTGLPRGKIVHGLTTYWVDEVVVDNSGKANLYSLA